MRHIKRWSRVATACAAGALALGLGTVAAQSEGDPWWWDVFDLGPIAQTSPDGTVTIDTDGPFEFHVMSGNLGRAKQEFPETGEYIGCQITSFPDNGQFLTCAARDASGTTLECYRDYAETSFQLRQHMMFTAAVNLTDTHYVAVAVDPLTSECMNIQVTTASADFLGEGESPDPIDQCNASNSIDLGVFGGSPVFVSNSACLKVTKFANGQWQYGPNRTMQLQNPAGGPYPLSYVYEQSCTGAKGGGQFDQSFDDQYLPGISDQCPLFIKLLGTGGNLWLRYW